MQYCITKLKREYYIYDLLGMTINSAFNSNISFDYSIRKENKLYLIKSYEVIDDFSCDRGVISHKEKEINYVGTIIFRTDNLYELISKWNDLNK